MASLVRRGFPYAAVGVVSAWLTLMATDPGDWSIDAWPAIQALGEGRVADYLSAKAMMGPFATLLQAPFAAIAPGGELDAYRWASFPCLVAAGVLGIHLARAAADRGAGRLFQAVLAALCLVNPLTIEALRNGHPEEILTASMAVAAVLSATRGRQGWTILWLGLAISSKQWAVIAILPTLMALPANRLRTAFGAGALVAVLMLPSLVVAPGSFSEVHGNAATTGRTVTPWSLWYAVAEVETEVHTVGGERLVAEVHEAPGPVGSLSHPLIVLLALAVPAALALRRRCFGLTGADAMALLSLLFLLRCSLDPVDNLYYHAPLLLALLGWDALAPPGSLPLRGLVGAAAAAFFWRWSTDLTDVAAFNYAYIAVASAGLAAIAVSLFRPGGRLRSFSVGRAPTPRQT